MKRIKLLFAVAILCAATAVGYNAYTNATMTEEERLMQANIDALSSGEEGSTGCYGTMGYSCSSSGSINLKCTNVYTAEFCSMYAGSNYYCCN